MNQHKFQCDKIDTDHLNQWQCDQIDGIFVQYFDIINSENLDIIFESKYKKYGCSIHNQIPFNKILIFLKIKTFIVK